MNLLFTEILKPTLADAPVIIHPLYRYHTDSYGLHIHDECELTMVLDGKMTYHTDESFEVLPGDIVFVNGRVPHSTETADSTVMALLQLGTEPVFCGKIPSRYINSMGKNSAILKADTDAAIAVRESFYRILSENETRGASYELFVRAEVMKIFGILCREGIMCDPASVFDERSISRLLPVIEYIDRHFCEDITLVQMSKMLCVDKTHFCRIFKNAVGMSFVNYLNLVRVSNAEKLLLTTEKSVVEIAAETGFSSPTYFTHVFKMYNRCSPGKYKKIKHQKAEVDLIPEGSERI